jgi:PEP-CTERM motif
MRMKTKLCFLVASCMLSFASVSQATTYTGDSNIADFTSLVTTYATFSNFSAGDVSSPFTPDAAELAANGFRVYAGGSLTGLPGGNNWILATFSSPASEILVFPNIDHFGIAYDGYQYAIEGSNDGTTWTPLFDALTVAGAGEPFTLGTYTGTAPFTVNNVLTPGAGPGGTVGYEAEFNFGTGYLYYAFGASTEGINSGNSDQELSAVGAVSTAPEPASLVLLGFVLVGLAAVRQKRHA